MRSTRQPAGQGRAPLGPRWRKVLRDAWQHKARTILVVLAIAVGILGAGAVLNTWSLLRRVTRGEYQASNPAAATLRTESIDAALLERVRTVPGIRDVQARRTVTGSARVRDGWRTAVLFVADDVASLRIGVVRPEAGAWPPPDSALVVEASSVELAATAVGESLAVRIGDAPPRMLPVAGIARDVGLAPGWMEHVVYAFVTQTTLAQLGAPPGLDELQIVVTKNAATDRDAVRRIAAGVREVVEGTGRTVTHVDVPVPGRHIHAAQIDSLLLTQGAFGVLALLASGLLVVNLIAAMLAGQVREIGVMKAVGARSAQIAGMYVGLAFGLGLAACALALPAAAVLGRLYARFTAKLLNFDIAGFGIPPQMILLQLAAGALLPVAAAAVPIVRGCRIPVSAALRDCGIEAASGRAGGRWLHSLRGPTRPIMLSLRNAFRRPQRLALTVAALAAGGAVYVGALGLRASIRGSVDALFASHRFDLGLRFERAWPADSLEAAIAAVPGVARTEAWGGTRATLSEPGGSWSSSTFTLSAPPAASRMFTPSLRSGRWPRVDAGNTLAVNRRLQADEPRLALGHQVTLLIGGRTALWKVVGVVETGPSPAAYTCRETLTRMTGDGRVDRAVVSSSAGGSAAQLELVQRLRAELGGRGVAVQSSQLMEQNRRVMEDHLLMVAGFLGAMGQLMIVVGGLGLASTMSLAVMERTREIGVLRAIGAPHRALVAMVQVEALVIAGLGWAAALPVSIPMRLVLGAAFGRIMIPVPREFVPEPAAVLQWLVVMLVVSAVAGAWPAYRATRVATATALAYE